MCDNVRMISSQRQHLILSRLRTRGAVRITALSKELGVSAMTIRRDIAELADKGLLKRVHGGAVTTSTLLSEPLFSVKSQMDIGLKDAIAQEAIKYVAPGDVIAIAAAPRPMSSPSICSNRSSPAASPSSPIRFPWPNWSRPSNPRTWR